MYIILPNLVESRGRQILKLELTVKFDKKQMDTIDQVLRQLYKEEIDSLSKRIKGLSRRTQEDLDLITKRLDLLEADKS